MYPAAGVCIVSTYDTFSRKRKDTIWYPFFLFADLGFEELTAIGQWHTARFRLDGIGSLQFFPRKELAPNPVIHPKKTGDTFGYLLFAIGEYFQKSAGWTVVHPVFCFFTFIPPVSAGSPSSLHSLRKFHGFPGQGDHERPAGSELFFCFAALFCITFF